MSIKDGHPDAHLWMQAAVPKSHRGKFTAKAKKAGMSTQAYARKEAHAPGTLGAEARLARRFQKIANR